MRQSLYHEVRVRPSISAVLVDGDGTVNGTAVPLNYNKQNFRNVMLVVVTGEVTDGEYTVSVEESANGTTGWTAVPDSRIEGTIAVVVADENDLAREFGVVPDFAKPYLRAVVTSEDITDGATVGAYFVLGDPNYTPVERA